MKYVSTRDLSHTEISSAQAIIQGLAPDGGLYVPVGFPKYNNYLDKSFDEIAFDVLRLYFTDFSEQELKECIQLAYSENQPAKLNNEVLELFHGRTASFKDVALQLFPHLLSKALQKCGEKREAVVVVATSGDTGSAALAGIADVPGLRGICFYPKQGVSPVQELQMVTQEGNNIHVFGIKGNFDDAQQGVKEFFGDMVFRQKFEEKFIFTSANSINLARLIPQIVHYFYAYSQLVGLKKIKDGDKVDFTIPSANFGNAAAAYYAKQMGLPVNKLIIATNSNNILDDFFQSGVFDKKRAFNVTMSPAMDILVSSNLERLIHAIYGCEVVNECYSSLNQSDKFEVDVTKLESFTSGWASETETLETIKRVYERSGYLLDPHTAVGECIREKYKTKNINILISTASPYKFPETVTQALDENALNNPPQGLKSLENKPILHSKVIDNIKKTIEDILI